MCLVVPNPPAGAPFRSTHEWQHLGGQPAYSSWYGWLLVTVHSVYHTIIKLPCTRACLISSFFDSQTLPSRVLASTWNGRTTGSSSMQPCPPGHFSPGSVESSSELLEGPHEDTC